MQFEFLWYRPTVVLVFKGRCVTVDLLKTAPRPVARSRHVSNVYEWMIVAGWASNWKIVSDGSWQDRGRCGPHRGVAGPSRRPRSNPLGVRECGTASATRTGRFKDHDVCMHGPCQAVPNLLRLDSAGALLGLPRYVAFGEWRILRHEHVFSMPIPPRSY